MLVINQREIAINILSEIFTKNAYNSISLRKTLTAHGELEPMQKAFITELVNGCIRNLIYLDFSINTFSNTKTTKMKPFILNLLRTGAYQILFMRVPDSAACNEAVNLAKKRGFGSLSGFVNGVLRTLARSKDTITLPDKSQNPTEYLCTKYSFPENIIKYWSETYDFATLENLCKASNENPKLCICINTTKTTAPELQALLTEEGIQTEPADNPNLFFISKTKDLSQSQAFKAGLFHVMDQSAMAACEVLSPKPGEKVLDLCSAPGGKSFYMAYLIKDTGFIQSNDIFPHKIELIRQGKERLKLNCINPDLQDATLINHSYKEVYDKVLADVPCSGLGLLSKKPDIRYNKDINQIKQLVKIQRKILANAAEYVKPGGFLCYSTCTISVLENENNISAFLKENPNFTLVSQRQILPQPGWDGFYIALLKKS